MSLKNLLFPLTMIVVAFVLFVFIKPAVSSLFDKVEQKKAKTTELAAMEKTKENIGALSSKYESLQADGKVDLVLGRLPSSSSQEQIVGSVNRIAEQSGVIVTNVSFEEKTETQTDIVSPISVDGSVVTELLPPKLPDPKVFSSNVKVNGSYEGIRAFFIRLSDMGQLSRVSSFSIGQIPSQSGESASSEVLSGAISIDFLYLPVDQSRYENGYLLPIFGREDFDMGSLIANSGSFNSTEILAPSVSGRANPFLP